MHRTSIFIIFFTLTNFAFSQEVINYSSVNEKTYSLYLEKNWTELIKLGKKSLDNNVDFFYLQYRMGIAYHELKNYRKAIRHFQNVVTQRPDDTIALEYLYYSYIFSGRFEDARILTHSFKNELKKKLRFCNEEIIVNGVGFEYKRNTFENYKVGYNTDTAVLWQRIKKDLNFFNFNLKHYTKKRLSLFHAVSYLKGNNLIFNALVYPSEFDETLTQFQYYISLNRHMKTGRDIKLAFHYIDTKLEAENPLDTLSSSGTGNNSLPYTSESKSFAANLSYRQSISNFDFKISATVSNFNDAFQTQPALTAVYYPFGNTNLYMVSDFAYQITDESSTGFYFKQKIGVGIFQKLWIEPFFLFGNINNFVENDAYIVYNTTDKMNKWFGANINLSLINNRLSLYFLFQQYSYTNTYYLNLIENTVNYNVKSILGGLKWNI